MICAPKEVVEEFQEEVPTGHDCWGQMFLGDWLVGCGPIFATKMLDVRKVVGSREWIFVGARIFQYFQVWLLKNW